MGDNVNNKIKRIKDNKIFNVLIMLTKAISTFLIILVICVVFIQRISNNEMTLGGYSIYTVVSESMVPEYKVWDMVVVKKTNPETINVGDDVVYLGKEGTFTNKIVTHRVIEIDKSSNKIKFTTKGLANDIADPVIEEDQIYGKVLFKSDVLSFFSKLINNLYGFYFVIFIPFVIILFFEILDIVKEREQIKGSK